MKKRYTFLILAMTALIVFGFFFYIVQPIVERFEVSEVNIVNVETDKGEEAEDLIEETDLATEDEEQIFVYKEDHALLYKESGTVFFQEPGKKETELVIEQIYVPSDTKIRTSDGVAVIVFLDDSLMTVDENTEVTIRFDEEAISVFQAIGNTWSRASEILSSTDGYEVQTPTALATVRGTMFGIKVVQSGDMNLLVKDGVVDVYQYAIAGEDPVFVAKVGAGSGFFPSQGDFSRIKLRELNENDLAEIWIDREFEMDRIWHMVEETDFSPHEYLEYLKNMEPDFLPVPELNLDVNFGTLDDPILVPLDDIYLEMDPVLTDPVINRTVPSETDTTTSITDIPIIDTTLLETDLIKTDLLMTAPLYEAVMIDPVVSETEALY